MTAVELLWGDRGRPARGPRPALTLAGIAGAAIAVADAEGLDAVSMQRVATALGVTKMALYRYVAGKAELLAVMTETALGDPPPLYNVPGDWRLKLEEWTDLLRATCQAHPWIGAATLGATRQSAATHDATTQSAATHGAAAPGATTARAATHAATQSAATHGAATHGAATQSAGTQDAATQSAATYGDRLVGPREAGWMEVAVAALEGTGLSGAERLDAVALLARHARDTRPPTADRRLSPPLGELVRRDSDRFPALVAATAEAGARTHDETWNFGLSRILDGLAALVESRSALVYGWHNPAGPRAAASGGTPPGGQDGAP